eukprot:1160997-Pelagomonas_calceolata.AAC.6
MPRAYAGVIIAWDHTKCLHMQVHDTNSFSSESCTHEPNPANVGADNSEHVMYPKPTIMYHTCTMAASSSMHFAGGPLSTSLPSLALGQSRAEIWGCKAQHNPLALRTLDM